MWGVPADHEMFLNINNTQWMWYFHNYIQDQDERMTIQRDMIEYHAGFLAPEMVEHVRNTRNESEAVPTEGIIGTTDDQAFADSINAMFGRDPGFGDAAAGEINDVSGNIADRMAEYASLEAERKKTSVYNYQYWANFDLE